MKGGNPVGVEHLLLELSTLQLLHRSEKFPGSPLVKDYATRLWRGISWMQQSEGKEHLSTLTAVGKIPSVLLEQRAHDEILEAPLVDPPNDRQYWVGRYYEPLAGDTVFGMDHPTTLVMINGIAGGFLKQYRMVRPSSAISG